MKKQYILFDFDGVIVNTEPQNAHYLQKTLKSFGVYMKSTSLLSRLLCRKVVPGP